jgi:hypothetical protein
MSDKTFFIDWEFIEDGHTIEPISVGIVCLEDARVSLSRGELEASIKDLANHAGISVPTFKRVLDNLQGVEFITVSSRPSGETSGNTCR